MKTPLLPPGLCDEYKCEIFANKDEVFGLYRGKVVSFTELPLKIQEAFIKEYRIANMEETVLGLFPDDASQANPFMRWLKCNYGGFDMNPDYEPNNHHKEHWDCGRRGKCPAEGIVCKSHKLSAREIDVIIYIAEGLPDKLIADKLSITINTVKTHTKNIRRKIGAYNRIDIMRFAIKNNFQNPN